MLDIVRTVFGIRKKRKAPPASEKPEVGAKIVRHGVIMEVSQPVGSEMWDWLMLSGWRVNTVHNDRRDYIRLPGDALTLLINAGSEKRGAVHSKLLKNASPKK